MNKRLLGLSLFSALIFNSCQTEDSPAETQEQSDYNISTDASELQQAINFNETGVVGVANITNNRGMKAGSVFGIEQIASLEPPVLDGTALRATHVDVNGDFAYISYNKEGATYLGAIDVVNISDKYNPELVSRLTTSIADINSLFVDNNNYLVFTGASAKDNRGTGRRSLMGYLELANGDLDQSFSNESDDPRVNPISNLDYGNQGNAGVHILPYNGEAISISGDAGAISKLEYPGIMTAFDGNFTEEIGDLRYAALKNNTLAVLSGVDGLMNFTINDSFELISKISTAPLAAESKRTITWYGDNVLVSEGSQGVGIYNFEAGAKLASLPLKVNPEAAEINLEDKVTNAVSTDGNFIYMANGGAGLDIIKLNETLNPVAEGIAEIQGSANFVQAKGEYIYVASGSGLKILKVITPAVDEETGSFLACGDFNPYTGDKNFTIASGEEFSYNGIMTLKHLNVNGILNFCGEMLVEKSANLSSDSRINLVGNFKLGNHRSSENLVISANSIFKVEGTVEIHGDLQIASEGTLEFVGDDSKIYVSGKVQINSGGAVIGEFEDLNNKFD
ncbi:hypothetical protein [Christiangramia sediminis]|uniref:LVIVD repeat-containing protein n=1 Tax=Christiangramia sediminis TaxID=2881336 RepID=A0A9X1RY37_9FLAO|nr:hypothetical protein [Christiangramia sediminis]MCB7482016.1 hypothetical protein [Christiangramia sediminis]